MTPRKKKVVTPSSEAERDYSKMNCHPKPSGMSGSQAEFEHWYHNQGVRPFPVFEPQAPSVCPKCGGELEVVWPPIPNAKKFQQCTDPDCNWQTGDEVESPQVDTKEGPYNLVGDLYVMGPGLETESRYGVAPDCLEAEHLNIAYAAGRKDLEGELDAAQEVIVSQMRRLGAERAKWEEFADWIWTGAGVTEETPRSAKEISAKLSELRSQKP